MLHVTFTPHSTLDTHTWHSTLRSLHSTSFTTRDTLHSTLYSRHMTLSRSINQLTDDSGHFKFGSCKNEDMLRTHIHFPKSLGMMPWMFGSSWLNAYSSYESSVVPGPHNRCDTWVFTMQRKEAFKLSWGNSKEVKLVHLKARDDQVLLAWFFDVDIVVPFREDYAKMKHIPSTINGCCLQAMSLKQVEKPSAQPSAWLAAYSVDIPSIDMLLNFFTVDFCWPRKRKLVGPKSWS